MVARSTPTALPWEVPQGLDCAQRVVERRVQAKTAGGSFARAPCRRSRCPWSRAHHSGAACADEAQACARTSASRTVADAQSLRLDAAVWRGMSRWRAKLSGLRARVFVSAPIAFSYWRPCAQFDPPATRALEPWPCDQDDMLTPHSACPVRHSGHSGFHSSTLAGNGTSALANARVAAVPPVHVGRANGPALWPERAPAQRLSRRAAQSLTTARRAVAHLAGQARHVPARPHRRVAGLAPGRGKRLDPRQAPLVRPAAPPRALRAAVGAAERVVVVADLHGRRPAAPRRGGRARHPAVRAAQPAHRARAKPV